VWESTLHALMQLQPRLQQQHQQQKTLQHQQKKKQKKLEELGA
jgi:hypothetical protein